jgi:AcrR family transcriptional regulator
MEPIVALTRRQRKENTTSPRREQILDAALAVFSDKGFTAATTAEIAKAAGVAEGSLYTYFASKRELFIAVIMSLILTDPVLTLIEKLPGADFPTVFKNILQDRLSLIESDNISRMASFISEIQRDPQLKALYTERFVKPLLSRIEGLYSTMSATGKVRQIEPALAARAIGGMIIGLVMLKILEGDTSPLSRLPQEKTATELMQLMLYGMLDEKAKQA